MLNEEKKPRYADLLDDDVFKLVFGQEATKSVMVEFLNRVIPDRKIVDIDFLDKEMKASDRRKKDSVFDMLCRTDDGTRVIVEVQRRNQDTYIERTIYYSTFQVQNQVNSGADEYQFCPAYVISIATFDIGVNAGNTEVKTMYRLREETSHALLTDRLTYIFIELNKFNKTLEELDGDVLEGIYYCFKNMTSLSERPEVLDHEVFGKIFEVTDFLNMNDETRKKILKNMTTERDLRNQFAYARKEGHRLGFAEGQAEGRAEGRAEERSAVAKSMKEMGLAMEVISKATGLSEEKILSL